ncbi:hypothetical protein ACLOJK_027120 [Asimina triloba]
MPCSLVVVAEKLGGRCAGVLLDGSGLEMMEERLWGASSHLPELLFGMWASDPCRDGALWSVGSWALWDDYDVGGWMPDLTE